MNHYGLNFAQLVNLNNWYGNVHCTLIGNSQNVRENLTLGYYLPIKLY
jgi:hypothetical protein